MAILLLAFCQYNEERKAGGLFLNHSINSLGRMLVACQNRNLCRWEWYIYWTHLEALEFKTAPKWFKYVFSQIYFQ